MSAESRAESRDESHEWLLPAIGVGMIAAAAFWVVGHAIEFHIASEASPDYLKAYDAYWSVDGGSSAEYDAISTASDKLSTEINRVRSQMFFYSNPLSVILAVGAGTGVGVAAARAGVRV